MHVVTVVGMINAAVGKAQLLIRQRFHQFSQLCDLAEVERKIFVYALFSFLLLCIYFRILVLLRQLKCRISRDSGI